MYKKKIRKKYVEYTTLYKQLEDARSENRLMSHLESAVLLLFNVEMYNARLLTKKHAEFKKRYRRPGSPIQNDAKALQAIDDLIEDQMEVSKDVERQYEAFSVEQFTR